MRFLTITVVVLVTLAGANAFAQGGMLPGRSLNIGIGKPSSREDSAKFDAAFRELYPLIRPVPGSRQIADRYLQRMLRNSATRGMDSLTVYRTIIQNLDTSADYEGIESTVRNTLTPADITALTAFLKTPAGTHYLAVEPIIVRARTDFVERSVAAYLRAAIGAMMPPSQAPHPPMGIPPPPPPPPIQK